MTIIQMSLAASVLIFAVMIIRALVINKLPKGTFLVLWGVVLCRLLIPFTIQTDMSAYNAAKPISGITSGPDTVGKAILGISENFASNTQAPLETAGAPATQHAIPTLILVWLIGIMLTAAFLIYTHIKSRREYMTALPFINTFTEKWLSENPVPFRRKIRILQSDKISAPLTYGVFRPVVLLPKNMDFTDTDRLQFVLTHEIIHIRQFDTLKKYLLAAALCIHWFNPLVLVMFILANRDIELSCDQSVVRTFGQHMKSSYALALIGMEETKSRTMPLCNNFSKNAIEERIRAIVKSRKTNIGGVVTAMLLVIIVTLAFATSAVEADEVIDLIDDAASVQNIKDPLSTMFPQYSENINSIAEENSAVSIDSTIFTDTNVYILISADGDLFKDLYAEGRIACSCYNYSSIWLKGSLKELELSKDGKQYYLYSAVIAGIKPGTEKDVDPMLLAAAGDSYVQGTSLKDHEGDILVLRVGEGENEHSLTAPVMNVYTRSINIRLDPDLQGANYYNKLQITPYMISLSGISTLSEAELRENEKKYSSPPTNDRWWMPGIVARILLDTGSELTIACGASASAAIMDDKVIKIGGASGGGDSETGRFGIEIPFRFWELDTDQVTAIVVNGVTYTVER